MKKKSLGILLALISVALIAGALYAMRSKPTPVTAPSETSGGYVNMNPATKSDQTYSNTKKQTSVQQTQGSSPNPNTPSQKQDVSPVITTWNQGGTNLSVNGFVQGVVEDGGTCTLTLTKDGKTVTQSRQGVSSATNTSCGQIDVPLSSLSPGTWSAVLSYSSSTSQGTSAPQNITIH